ncbi:TrkH family potassium uptake protein [Parvularcula dongshanensis]|uniref:Trk system potassium uptake protein n=1 Tax=Parvularcula dongshanensis TaxID=1173995 RepID=A0A840I5E8_9PROT|nr:TrkH family potassium uptake protein [Parvularcula dongshanensis]MBB4660017.1 trk system potassium uptake protein TrkH [Parvularcula dongshanensis]
MAELRPVFLVVGIFLTALGVVMTVPMLADLGSEAQGASADRKAFGLSAMISVATGVAMASACWGRIEALTTRQGFLITTLSWVALVTAASLPFAFGPLRLGLTDSFFEAMSGLTTTGATVVLGLDDAPRGFLLWRSILQWIGGIGVIIMAIAVLPFLSVGGMQLFRMESSDKSDKILPGASQLASAIFALYLGLTGLCFTAYWGMGMSAFDAVNHAMTTIATGGYSTHDASFGYFLSAGHVRGPVDLVATLFMILGSLPFGAYVLMFRGRVSAPIGDSQVRFFLAVAIVFTGVIAARIMTIFDYSIFDGFRLSVFNVVSIMTGTGYASTDYGLWGPFAIGFFFCIMFVGGCAGSTSCGLKIFRLQVALAALAIYARRLAHPHRVTIARYNGRPLNEDVVVSVLSFFFIYFATFATVAVLLSLFQLDAVTALSAAGSAVANVGPGLGDIVGPAGNYGPLPAGAKWLLSIAMLMGRLELLTVLVLFVPSFWRR